MLYFKKQIINELKMRIFNLEKYLKKVKEEYNKKFIEWEQLNIKHKELCKSYNGLRKKYLKLKQPTTYYQKWEELKGEKL